MIYDWQHQSKRLVTNRVSRETLAKMVQPSKDETALFIEGLSFSYGTKPALRDFNLTIAPGETVILLGPNGAGKTTLFSLICGLFAHRLGTIRIGGVDAALHRSQALAGLGVVFQAQTLDLDLTVAQNLAYFCALRGINRIAARARIERELDQLEMAHRINEKVRNLNGGHRRRVEIARAKLSDPKLLLLDEPTVGLDISTRSGLISHLHERHDGHAVAILWATHLIDEIMPGDRVLVLHQGKLAADGTPAEIMQRTGAKDLAQAFNTLTSSGRVPVKALGQ